MPKILTRSELYRIFQRELPEDVYPDGPAEQFHSTASISSKAKALATSYENLENIYDNYFPNYASDRLVDFEELYFGRQLDSSLSESDRMAAIISKIRTRRRSTPSDIKAIVQSIVGEGVLVEIVEWGCGEGSWILNESQLEVSTILSVNNRLGLTGPDLCGKNAEDFGLSEADYLAMREEAYTYEIRIYDYTLTADQESELERLLDESEPARSDHVISDGLDPADAVEGDG